VAELFCQPTGPWGIAESVPSVAAESLEPGDSVLLYTDGVIEARGPDGAFFGLDRLIDLTNRHASNLLTPEAILRHVISSVCEHRGSEPLADDATVVLVRWDGAPPS
jgi:serine phosphatase RsbU (regulator of sigma subunit)